MGAGVQLCGNVSLRSGNPEGSMGSWSRGSAGRKHFPFIEVEETSSLAQLRLDLLNTSGHEYPMGYYVTYKIMYLNCLS